MTENNQTPQETPFYKKKWFPPATLASLVLLGGGAYMVGVQQANHEEEAPQPTIEVTNAPQALTTASPSESIGSLPASDPASPSPSTATSTPVEVQPETEVEKAALAFTQKLKEGDRNGKDWADNMKPLVSSALYESMKPSGSALVPPGAVKVSVSEGKGEGNWEATARDSEGKELYTFKIKGVRTQDGSNPLLVTQIDGLPTTAGQKDERGYPLPVVEQPLNEELFEAMKISAYSTVKKYLEYEKGDSLEERREVLKKALPGGFPELRPTPEGLGYDVQAYAPAGWEFAERRQGVSVGDGVIGLDVYVAYADAAFNPVKDIEEVGLRVNFTYKESSGWTPDSLELISHRPFH